jgi:predicted metal-dependent hydrolase
MKIDKLIRSKRRTIGLQICPDSALIVRAPSWAKMAEIDMVVAQHADWIRKKQVEALNEQRNTPVRQFIDGEEFPFLGRNYSLHITSDSKYALTFNDAFYLSANYRDAGRRVFTLWYKNQARQIITQRVQLYAARANLRYAQLRITNASKRWGSCSHKGNLNFAWRLVLAPIAAIDYVAAHELAHIVVRNHSRLFWDKVEAIYPGYEVDRAWLRDNGRFLTL